MSKLHAMETPVAVPLVCLSASNGTIVANPRHRRGARIASSRCVGWRSSNPSLCLRQRGSVVPRPCNRLFHQVTDHDLWYVKKLRYRISPEEQLNLPGQAIPMTIKVEAEYI